MSTLKVKNADGVIQYIKYGAGDGTINDPFTDLTVTNDETNMYAAQLSNGTTVNQNINGLTNPSNVFSTAVVPDGKVLVLTRIIIYMESANVMNSNLFGDQTALTNGWEMIINGESTLTAKQNRELGQYMYDMQGVKIYGKEDKTLSGRFTFAKMMHNGKGITIREGEVFSTKVNDDLTGLTYLEVMAEGQYLDA